MISKYLVIFKLVLLLFLSGTLLCIPNKIIHGRPTCRRKKNCRRPSKGEAVPLLYISGTQFENLNTRLWFTGDKKPAHVEEASQQQQRACGPVLLQGTLRGPLADEEQSAPVSAHSSLPLSLTLPSPPPSTHLTHAHTHLTQRVTRI